jgi:hypothetical protein
MLVFDNNTAVAAVAVASAVAGMMHYVLAWSSEFIAYAHLLALSLSKVLVLMGWLALEHSGGGRGGGAPGGRGGRGGRGGGGRGYVCA